MKRKKVYDNLPPLDDVVNLSDVSLTENERKVLSNGLKFCPTPGEPHMGDVRRDLDKFHRSLRLKHHFGKMNIQNEGGPSTGPFKDTSKLKLQSNSNWNLLNGPVNLESIIHMNELGLLESDIKDPSKHNITSTERASIKNLAQNTIVVIKPADKGGAIVIQNREDYVMEGERQLSDPRFYKKVDKDLTTTHNSEIVSQLELMRTRGEITQKVKDYLIVDKPRTSQLYLLPKIHKKQTPVPGRPVVSANESPTKRISAFVDLFLAPLVKQSKSYVKDTSDFLRKLNDIDSITEKDILVTLDVSSLYTNIPNDEGTEAAYEALSKARIGDLQPSNLSLLEMLAQVLTYNNFQFDGENYLQVGGTAMGTRLAPSYANIFMSNFKEKHVYSNQLQPKVWYRLHRRHFLHLATWVGRAQSFPHTHK